MSRATSREFWIGTSWKMNGTIGEAEAYLARLGEHDLPEDAQIFVVPPFTALAAARRAIGDRAIRLGAQTMHWSDRGAHTGEISPLMLVDCGVEIVEIGHSERRADQAETDATVNAKIAAALDHGLRPLLCVGDRADELAAGASIETIVRQIKLAFAGIDPDRLRQHALIAYEPVWAIGESGRVAPHHHVAAVHGAVRAMLDGRGLDTVPLLYGGSVTVENAPGLAAIPSVDGLFVGRAAWTADGFAAVIAAALAGRRSRAAA